MTDTTVNTNAELMELLLNGGDEGLALIAGQAASAFTRGRTPDDLSPEAREYVLDALDFYIMSLDVARTSLYLLTYGAPNEVVDAFAADGIPFMEEFERRQAEFYVAWPEYSEWASFDCAPHADRDHSEQPPSTATAGSDPTQGTSRSVSAREVRASEAQVEAAQTWGVPLGLVLPEWFYRAVADAVVAAGDADEVGGTVNAATANAAVDSDLAG